MLLASLMWVCWSVWKCWVGSRGGGGGGGGVGNGGSIVMGSPLEYAKNISKCITIYCDVFLRIPMGSHHNIATIRGGGWAEGKRCACGWMGAPVLLCLFFFSLCALQQSVQRVWLHLSISLLPYNKNKLQWRLHNCSNTTEATTLLQQFIKIKQKKCVFPFFSHKMCMLIRKAYSFFQPFFSSLQQTLDKILLCDFPFFDKGRAIKFF